LDGNYSFPLEERVRVISSTFEAIHKDLYERLPDLPELAKSALEYRKSPQKIKGDPVQLWFLAKKYLEEVMNYILGIFPSALNSDSCLEKFLNNVQFTASQLITEKKIEVRMIGTEPPEVKFRKAIFFLSSALSDEKAVNVKMLQLVFKMLKRKEKITTENGLKKWESLKDEVCGKWKYACTNMGW
jgi:hypothetical protein